MNATIARKDNRPADEQIYSSLTNPKGFSFSYLGQREPRKIEQKWSFTEIVKFLESNAPSDFDMSAIVGMLHMYGVASHLIHADAAALDLIHDRQEREPAELEILAASHVVANLVIKSACGFSLPWRLVIGLAMQFCLTKQRSASFSKSKN